MRAHPGREDGFRPPGAAHRTHLLLGDHLSGGRASKSRGPPAVCPCRPGPLSRCGVRSLGRSTEDLFVVVVNALLWTRYGQPRWRTREIYSIDGSTITLGLNIFKKRYRKTGLVNQDYTRGHSPTNGYYFGYKLTLVIEHPSLIPVAFLLHRRPSGDARFLPTVPVDLNRKILRAEDTVIPSSVILQQAFDEKRKLQRVAEAKSYGFMHHPRRQNTMLPARSTEKVAQKGISGTCPLHAAQKDRCRNVIRIWR